MQSYMHMRCKARQLDSYSTARHCSTARQLDRTRQSSTELDTLAHAVSLDLPRQLAASQLLDSYSTATRQLLDSYSTATRQLLDSYSTATRQLLDRQGLDSPSTAASTAARRSLDSSTARQPGLNQDTGPCTGPAYIRMNFPQARGTLDPHNVLV